MHIEQKQNKIFKPQSIYTLAAEESNQVTTEIENQISAGGLTPSSGSLTQLRDSIKNVVDTAANNLQSQIDAITSASDVFDVVGTYAQLQAYDKSTVPLNDIIKVLQDSTHNNAAAYYRLVDASGDTEWQYIGQEGPYYTKSEIDTDFALKSELPSIATTQQVGLVKPDNQTTFVANDGTLSISGNVAAALPLFTPIWADHLLNDASYLRADTFSWQSGAVYTEGYNHLVADISGVTAQTETIGSYTITFYRADDGHKIVLADQETTVQNIYNATGVAWYYILDTANTQFKLPRTKWDFVGLRDTVGKYVPESLPNITGTVRWAHAFISSATGAYQAGENTTEYYGSGPESHPNNLSFDASRSSSAYQNSAPVQQRATQMYLYFYVGNFSQSATEQTAGLNAELFNQKVDKADMTEVQCIVETYSNGTEWYRVWSDGWCEQGGYAATGTPNKGITFLKPFRDTNYSVFSSVENGSGDTQPRILVPIIGTYTTTGVTLQSSPSYSGTRGFWQAKGYIS